jgi:succinyl-CoA synthetase alpha subunit
MLNNHVLRNVYRDSVALMRLSREMESLEGIAQATAIMGTDNNKELLQQAGLLDDAGLAAGPNDLIVAFDAASPELEPQVLLWFRERLEAREQGLSAGQDYRPRSLEGAVRALPEANLAIISVPGEYAAREARKALDLGLHVLMFSDNVPIKDEVSLKQHARNLGLFMMGPDCGTAVVNGAPLGFSNAVPKGRVGLVSASGSGLQQVMCLLAQAGEGVSHGLGVGGRDLSEEVNGIMMLEGLKALEQDRDTEVIVLISKPPAQTARARVMAAVRTSSKPCVVAFLGESPEVVAEGRVYAEMTLEDASLRALSLLGKVDPPWLGVSLENTKRIKAVSAGQSASKHSIRGLYSGGTLCYEALVLLKELGHQVCLEEDLGNGGNMDSRALTARDVLTDLGDDRYTVGRPHPMIDFRTRCERVLQAASQPEIGVLLLDVILGYGAHPDPAAELVPAIEEAQRIVRSSRRELACVISLCGSPEDPQGLLQQQRAFTEAGAVVARSNALAVRIASAISRGSLTALPLG